MSDYSSNESFISSAEFVSSLRFDAKHSRSLRLVSREEQFVAYSPTSCVPERGHPSPPSTKPLVCAIEVIAEHIHVHAKFDGACKWNLQP